MVLARIPYLLYVLLNVHFFVASAPQNSGNIREYKSRSDKEITFNTDNIVGTEFVFISVVFVSCLPTLSPSLSLGRSLRCNAKLCGFGLLKHVYDIKIDDTYQLKRATYNDVNSRNTDTIFCVERAERVAKGRKKMHRSHSIENRPDAISTAHNNKQQKKLD